MIDRPYLKQQARNELVHIFAEPWLLALLMCLISDLLLFLSVYTIIGFFLLMGPLTYGLIKYFVKLHKKQEPLINDVFSAFAERFQDSFLLGFLEMIFIMLWSLLFVVPGIVKSYSYSMSQYLLLEDPSLDWRQAHEKSRQMMYGHKFELFILDLSFLGWYIVGILCFGFGVLWVIPYHQATKVNFYLALDGKNINA